MIELIVVIAVIAILSGIVTMSVTSQLAKGRDARRIADLSQVQKALEVYYSTYSCYPASTNIDGDRSTATGSNPNPCPGTSKTFNADCGATTDLWWNTSLKVLVELKLLPNLPVDPLNKNGGPLEHFCYVYTGELPANNGSLYKCDAKLVRDYVYTLLFSTEKLKLALPVWTYGSGGGGIFDYCYVGKYIGP